MKVLVQRVLEAACLVDSKEVSSIEKGLLLFVGLEVNDTQEDLEWMAKKVSSLRIFEDESKKMNLDVHQVSGAILSISQFTLAGNVSKGNRPSFTNAMEPFQAQQYYLKFNQLLRQYNLEVKEGVFQADMKISLINDGPVTISIERGK